MELGHRIRQIRLEQNRTLEDVAGQCGLTKSFLSKIETGKSVPTVSSLMNIADALGVKVSVLLDDEGFSGTVFTEAICLDEEHMIKTDKGYSFCGIAMERRNKNMQPYIFHAKKGEVLTQGLSHDGEEFVYVLEGQVKYRVGSQEYLLKEGDSLYFDSLLEHELDPVSDVVRFLAVFSK